MSPSARFFRYFPVSPTGRFVEFELVGSDDVGVVLVTGRRVDFSERSLSLCFFCLSLVMGERSISSPVISFRWNLLS